MRAPVLDRRVSAGRTSRDRELSARPIVWLLAGYPLWWVLGLGTLIFQILGVVLAVIMLRRGSIRVPPGFGWWVMFLVIAAASFALLGLNPPGTVPGSALSRAPVAIFRFTQYVSIGIIALYVMNLSRSSLSVHRLGRLLGLLFVYAILIGSVAIVWPGLEWPSPLELVLPQRLTSDAWVASMIHPSVAQVQTFLGYELGRPAGPFGYTNTWGANVAILLPWFVATWIITARGGRRAFGVAILALAIAPIIWSVNRGLWIAILVGLVLAAVLLLRNGRAGVVVPAAIAAAVLGVLVAMSPLGTVAMERLETPHSNQIREFTTEKAIELSTHSPLLGFGSTRDSIGSAQSVAVGRTPECPQCGNTPLGQNGQVWMVLIGQGVVGLVLFFGVFVRGLVAAFPVRTLLGGAAAISLVAGFIMTFYYDLIISPLALWFISLAAVWRLRWDAEDDVAAISPATT